MTAEVSWRPYYRACLKSPEAIDVIERILETSPRDESLSLDELRRRSGRGMSLDQVIDILSALAAMDLGALDDMRWRPNSEMLVASAVERRRVRDAVAWTAAELLPNTPRLLISSPTGVGAPQYQTEFADLRTTLRSIIASTQRQLIMAAPFWDFDVANELAPLVRKRLEANVHVRLLARTPFHGTPSAKAIALFNGLEANGRRCDIRIVDKPSSNDRFGRETFHFKMVGADSESVYVGSANFDTAGFASRWELGVVLRERPAVVIFSFVNQLANMAAEYTPQ